MAQTRRLVALATTLIVMLIGLSPAGEATSFAQEPNQDLYELAKKAGGKLVLRYLPDRSVVYPNLEELAKRTDIIVVGRTLGHRAKLR